MKYGSTSKRSRSKSGNGRKNYQPRNKVYDSNGPDVRIRGTAHQIAEKYMTLAKDSASAGDRVIAENYMQHAEHYLRIINGFSESTGGTNNRDAGTAAGNDADSDVEVSTRDMGNVIEQDQGQQGHGNVERKAIRRRPSEVSTAGQDAGKELAVD